MLRPVRLLLVGAVLATACVDRPWSIPFETPAAYAGRR